MSGDIERLRNDLEAMQQIVGPKLSLDRTDVRDNLLLVVGGALAAAAAWVVPFVMIRWSVLPVALAAIPSFYKARVARSESNAQAAQRREARVNVVSAALLLAVTVPYVVWQRHAGISAGIIAGGACVRFSGVGCALLAITSPARRYYWGYAFSLVLWGLAFPHESLRQIAASGGIACMLAGGLAAAIVAWQLRDEPEPRRAN